MSKCDPVDLTLWTIDSHGEGEEGCWLSSSSAEFKTNEGHGVDALRAEIESLRADRPHRYVEVRCSRPDRRWGGSEVAYISTTPESDKRNSEWRPRGDVFDAIRALMDTFTHPDDAAPRPLPAAVKSRTVTPGARTPDTPTFKYNDGGRFAAGRSGDTGDCVTRAVCIATGAEYTEVYKAMAAGMGKLRGRASASRGVSSRVFAPYLQRLGWRKRSSASTYFNLDAVPQQGTYIVWIKNHLLAVIDGVIHDTHTSYIGKHRKVVCYYAAPGNKGAAK